MQTRSPDYNALYDYADLCAGEGRHDEALELYEQLSRSHPDDDSLILSMSWVYREKGDRSNALRCLEGLLEKELARNIFTGFAYDELVRMYRDMEAHEPLLLLCERAVERHPADAALLLTLGEAYLRGGRNEEAFRIFTQLVSMDPDAPLYHLNRAQAAAAAGRSGEADEACSVAMHLEPDDADRVCDRMAAAFEKACRADRAEYYRKEAIRLSGNNPHHRLSLGELYLRQGRLAEARAAFEEACRIDPPSRAAFHNRLANLMVREGLGSEASAEFKKALDADPTNPFYCLNLIGCCEAIGDHEGARRYRELGRRTGALTETREGHAPQEAFRCRGTQGTDP